MAKMIPSVISPEVKSTAEKHIFEWFKTAPETDDWIVLHSLGIANHNKVIHGETDFFVLIPYKGLFALEVKGGRVCRKKGIWYFTDKYGNSDSSERGPFDQAWDGIFSIINDIKAKLDSQHRHLENIFYGIGVMFPDVEYITVGCDEEQWQVFDCNDGNRVRNYMERLFSGSCDKWKTVFGYDIPYTKLPSDDDILYIANLLRGDFDKAVALNVQIRNSEEELIRLTEEQYRCIDQLDDNKRCLIDGGAGTGKTLIAIEETKKALATGNKTALFCYNKNLGYWLTSLFEGMPENLKPAYVGSFHRYMSNVVRKAGIDCPYPRQQEEQTQYYTDDLPAAARIAFTQLNEQKFDKIIIDEAQDLICKQYLDVFDRCLAGGLERGRWTFLGDFSQQAIYNASMTGSKMKELIEQRTSFIRFKLTINCRNTKTICDEITAVTGYDAPSEIWSRVDGAPVQYMTYSTMSEQKEIVVNTIRDLLNSHIPPRSINILSPKKRENSVISTIDEFEIPDYKTYGKNKISFCTIQGFKGLENSIIILTDIDSIADKKLMYVALSRARAGLYVIETENARQEYVANQIRRVTNGFKT